MSIIHQLQARAYLQSADKGFHDYAPTDPRAIMALQNECIALIHSEASEALEQLRTGRPVNQNYYPHHEPGCAVSDWKLFGSGVSDPEPECTCTPKPEGVPSELADVVIRVMDFCDTYGIDLHAAIVEKLDYNATRGHKHGGKAF